MTYFDQMVTYFIKVFFLHMRVIWIDLTLAQMYSCPDAYACIHCEKERKKVGQEEEKTRVES